MFFANALKDYVDQLNDLVLLLNDNFTVFTFFKSLFIYLFDSLKFSFIYLFSCKWLTNFIELPCTFKGNFIAIIEGKNILESAVSPSFFQFLETKSLTSNYLVTGFLNSFFLALPLSIPHLLTLRAFLINGLPAGLYAAAGTILGQFTFLVCVFFGFEFILTPFFTFEPFNYILGLVIVINLLYNMVHKPNMGVLNKTQSSLLLKFFGLNFLFAWTEQTSLFQYFGNLTVNRFPTLLQGATDVVSQGNFLASFVLPNAFYLIGILVGSICWTIFFGFCFITLRSFVAQKLTIPFMFLNERIHKLTLILTFTFCLTSIPYYGLDYLIASPLGFISQDKALDFLKAKPNYQYEARKSGFLLLDTFSNPVPFDRPVQMEPPLNQTFSTFEDYSIEAENSWKNKTTFRPGASKLNMAKGKLKKEGEINEPNQTEIFKENFYNLTKIEEKKSSSQVETDLDLLAKDLFNSIAYNYYDQNAQDFPYTRNLFREKFYTNSIYKALVNLDMVGFLQGQPKSYNLTANDEAELYKRRVVLENYLNSIHEYKNLVVKEQNNNSYAEKVYNQQFKGSLDLVRHYFSISLTAQGFEPTLQQTNQPKNLKKVLKFDQPLYKDSSTDYNVLLHEELDPDTEMSSSRGQINSLLTNVKENKAFQKMEEIDTTPFYIGWDGSLRKFLVKKACIPGIPFGNEAFSPSSSSILPTYLPTYLSFQSWPLSFGENDSKFYFGKKVLFPYTPLSETDSLKLSNLLNVEDLGYSKAKVKNSNLLQKQNLPLANWKRLVETDKRRDELKNYIDLGAASPPQFGGLAWPNANINAQEVIKKTLKQK